MGIATRIYFDFLNNLFSYLLIYALAKNKLSNRLSNKAHTYMIIFCFVYALPETLPLQTLTNVLINIIIVMIVCSPNYKKGIKIFIEFELLMIIGGFIIQLIHSLFTMDLHLIVESPYYVSCKMLICTALVYIVYILYINGKRMKQLRTHYHHMFTVVILSISLALSYLTLFISQTQDLKTPAIPILFSALFILIAMCINIYRRFIDLAEENIHTQVLLEQNKMTADYSEQIETNLKELHSLRHDIRNHLITIDGYASQERYNSIHEYISKITNSYTDIPLFDTPSEVVSALLNAKHQVARQNNIQFSIDWDFAYIHIDDFSIITILGNLIDNAITAAAKCKNGNISLELIQSGSYLKLHMRNNHTESIQEKNGEFKTTKAEDRTLHGLGIKNIRSTVEQLNGQIDITYTEDIFDVDILVPNY